jgi:hypothetical protein
MFRIGEYLVGLVMIVLMLPILFLGFIAASFDVVHYFRNRRL